jgi:hypothetical protein
VARVDPPAQSTLTGLVHVTLDANGSFKDVPAGFIYELPPVEVQTKLNVMSDCCDIPMPSLNTELILSCAAVDQRRIGPASAIRDETKIHSTSVAGSSIP